MKRYLILAVLAFSAVPVNSLYAQSVSVETPLNYHKLFSGDQPLRFTNGGQALKPKKARLSYRVISNKADWKRVWGYLYDSSLDVDFKKHRVLAVYKSPAAGGFRFTPKRVFHGGGALSVTVEAAWDGKTAKGHPFLFMVVDPFKKLTVEETFLAPDGKKVRYP